MGKVKTINEIRERAVETLRPMVDLALEEAAGELSQFKHSQDLAEKLLESGKQTCQRFERYLGSVFQELVGKHKRKIELGDYPMLSLVDRDYLESANALEGMIAYSRNLNIKSLINFQTRLDKLFDNLVIDETNNPLEPDKIAQAFVDALAPLKIPRQHTLTTYRCFNQRVLRNLNLVLDKVNEVCIANGLMPDLNVDGRSRGSHLKKRSSSRPTNSPLERAFHSSEDLRKNAETATSEQLYITVGNLLRSPSFQPPGTTENSEAATGASTREIAIPTEALIPRHFPGSVITELGLLPVRVGNHMQIADRDVELLSRKRLFGMLDRVQDRMVEEISGYGDLKADYRQFTDFLGQEMMRAAKGAALPALDASDFDTVLIVSLLYDALSRDDSLVRPIKELVVATQVVMMKIALTDRDLFIHASHPARQLLNEVAAAGIGWIDLDKLRNDPAYNQLESLLVRLVTEYRGDSALILELLAELDEFNNQALLPAGAPGTGEPGKFREYDSRIAGIHEYVRYKIQERIRKPLSPVVDELVNQHYHRFLVNVMQRDGQGSGSWVLVMKILDLLLWSVRPDKKEGDKARFEKLNDMLHSSLRKALVIAGLDERESADLLARLWEEQEAGFGDQVAVSGASSARKADHKPSMEVGSFSGTKLADVGRESAGNRKSGAEEQFLKQVHALPIGVWLKFRMEGDRSVNCTLAARLNSIDRLIFVNRQGVRVVEKSSSGLARELRDGTVKIISEWPLFERGMEAVIASLRERQQDSRRND